jgi:hypothetical protein
LTARRRWRAGSALCALALATCTVGLAHAEPGPAAIDERVEQLLGQKTVEEKIGQLTQANVGQGGPPSELRAAVKAGKVGAVLDMVDVATVNMTRVTEPGSFNAWIGGSSTAELRADFELTAG